MPSNSTSEEKEYWLTGKGVALFTITSAIEGDTLKANIALTEMCKIIALKHYGKSALAIRNELLKMPIDKIVKWIDNVWGKYITDSEILDILSNLKNY